MTPRKLPENFPFKIRTSGAMTLILIDGVAVAFENSSPLGKDKMIDSFMEFDGRAMLLLAWTGQYKTDIFELTREDILKHYR